MCSPHSINTDVRSRSDRPRPSRTHRSSQQLTTHLLRMSTKTLTGRSYVQRHVRLISSFAVITKPEESGHIPADGDFYFSTVRKYPSSKRVSKLVFLLETNCSRMMIHQQTPCPLPGSYPPMFCTTSYCLTVWGALTTSVPEPRL